MKRKTYVVLIIFVPVSVLCWTVYSAFFSMSNLPQGSFLCESTSPRGTYTVRLFQTNPALSSGCTRGELEDNNSGKTRNVYWEYNRNLTKSEVGNDIIWEDDDTVIVNGKRLSLPNDRYDWRRLTKK